MSRQMMNQDLDESYENFVESNEDLFFFDDSESSICSDEEIDFENEAILKHIAQKREEEQREKDIKQIQGLQEFNIRSRYSWQSPASNDDIGFRDLLVEEQKKQQSFQSHSTKKTKSVGFKKTTPEIVFGPTGLIIKDVACSYFLKGNCTRPKCAYYHPVNEKCRFDPNCKNPKCVFVHSTNANDEKSKHVVKPTITESPQIKDKRKHRICLNTLKFVENTVVPTGKTCKHGDNCSFAHTIGEIMEAVKADQEKFQCKFGKNCRNISFENFTTVVNNKPKTVFTYQNKTEFCYCPRVHYKESIINFLVRVQNSPRPPPKKEPFINHALIAHA